MAGGLHELVIDQTVWLAGFSARRSTAELLCGATGSVMIRYDPMVGPDPAAWQALSELEQLDAILEFHRRARVRLPNDLLHATIHSVVESQVALGGEIPVAETLQRLMDEGLDRHEGIHAIGMVVTGHMHDLLQGDGLPAEDPNAPYYAEL